MNTDNHRLISDLSKEYVESLSQGDHEATFTCGDITAAYIIGAEEALRRVCNVIRESAVAGGLTSYQSQRLIGVVELIESNPKAS